MAELAEGAKRAKHERCHRAIAALGASLARRCLEFGRAPERVIRALPAMHASRCLRLADSAIP